MADRSQKTLLRALPVVANGVVDLAGFNALTIAVLGAVAGAAPIITLTDSADNSTFAAVDDQYIVHDEAEGLNVAAGQPFSIGYVGGHRYVKVGVSGLGAATMVAILGEPKEAPIDAPANAD